jgi:hypothetical protein
MSTKIKPLNAYLFANGNIAVTDGREQIPELQEAPISLWAWRAEELGYDVDGLLIETPLGKWRLIKTASGWNRFAE